MKEYSNPEYRKVQAALIEIGVGKVSVRQISKLLHGNGTDCEITHQGIKTTLREVTTLVFKILKYNPDVVVGEIV